MDEDLIETKISSEDIYDGNLLHVRKDTVRLPDGNTSVREWITHPGASAVIPLLPDGRVVLVRQYRYPVQAVTLEIPAGKLDSAGEDPLECAKRELKEETGYTAEKYTMLTKVATTVGFSNEFIHMADMKELDPQKRIFRLRFNFKNRQYDKTKPYYLVAVDEKSNVEVLRHSVVMDIVFANNFGFGV